ncbi:DNA cytosine methyltransferase [Longicatena caecimuris]|uniref:DNA cytosine methyltransferase n=1 Tax=Longicatena caecimuris TaxID=1796635 RepID=UPI0022E72005|nr:DNA cytosine methyltransferase [Longicatena caecimuris]
MKKNNCMDAIELREILKINQNLLDDTFDNENYRKNLELLTCKTKDQYLDNRGAKFKEAVKKDEELRDVIGRLKYRNIKDDYILKYFNFWCAEQRNNNSQKFNFIDLFCGAGGLSLGFLQEGFDVNFACDIEQACVETYSFNHPNVPSKHIVNDDIKNIENNIYDYLRYKNVDLVIGGPPCQGFSIANQQRIIDDPRNKLYKSFVNVVDKTTPKLFVMENVKGMLKVALQVKEDFEKIGYKVAFKVFNAQDFGVPQNRERLIFIGSRLDVKPEDIISKIESLVMDKHVLKDAIGDLNSLEASKEKNNTNLLNEKNGGIVIKKIENKEISTYVEKINNGNCIDCLIFNHQARYNNDRDIEIYGRLNQGDKSDDPKIKDIMPYANRSHIFKDKYYKLKNDDKCKTITAHMKFDCNMYIHPTQARGLTPREAARVQSYPDDYVFKGSFTKTYMQIGNSVPPLMGRGIANVIKKILEELL